MKTMRKFIALIIVILGVVADQLFKGWVVANIPLGSSRGFIPGLLDLTYLQNNGAAWSSLEGQQWFFLILTPIIVIIAGYFLWKKMDSWLYFISLSLVIAGALGNFIDRLQQGFVVDMFQTTFINFPIFNIADSLLSVGFVILFIAILTDKDDKNA